MNQSNNSKFVPTLPDDDDNTVKIYEGVAEFTMSDADTLKSVKVKAKDLATQKVQRKIADYVYAFWKDRYLTLPDDEVLSIANEISNITDVKYNVLDSDDNVLVRAVVTAQVDDNDVMNYIIQFFKERTELKSQNESLRKENESLRKENEDLRRQIANNQQNTSQVVSKDKIVLSEQKLIEGRKLHGKKDYTGAIRLYDEAISLNPNNAEAYKNRGKCYQTLGKHEESQADFKKAKSLRKKG